MPSSAATNCRRSKSIICATVNCSWCSSIFTGMRVTKHDGSRHHLIGVQPTVPMARTIAGVRAGKDEVLDAALAWIARQPQ